MPAVLVHGVPDTAESWAPLTARLARRDVVCPRFPGFASPVPDGFGCTKDEYVDWLAGELAALGEPVDLVGHDWGSLIAQRLATTRPELVRTWVLADGAMSEQFAWHDLAKQWQTPEVGEQVMELMGGDAIIPGLTEAGHPDAAGAAARIDDTMKAAILALYRSAVDINPAWIPPPRSSASPPALVLWGARDQFGPPEYGRAAAALAGAPFVELDAGHWSVIERPDQAAAELERFWAAS
jgi:pimeloyl-ACP methyl ester carboxylesterase